MSDMAKAKSYRLGDIPEAEVAALARKLGLTSHAEVLRVCIRYTALQELDRDEHAKIQNGKSKRKPGRQKE